MQQAPTFGRRGFVQTAPAPRLATASYAPPVEARGGAAFPLPPSTPARARQPRGGQARGGIVWLLTSFEGRARRLHYWAADIGLSIAYVAATSAIRAAFPSYPSTLELLADPMRNAEANMVPALLMSCCLWPILIARTAVYVKRWHDRGKSGWFAILNYVPLVNFWPFIELGFFSGPAEANRFGPSPKGPGFDPAVFD